MSFIMDLIIKQGVQYLPQAIKQISDKLGEGEAILIVPAKEKLFLVTGKFDPRIVAVSDDKKDMTISTAQDVICKTFVLPDEIDLLMTYVNGKEGE